MDAKYIEATRVAQAIIASSQPDFRVDGHWGSFTETAFNAVPASTRNAIVAAVASFNLTPHQLKTAFDLEKLDKKKAAAEKTRALLERGGTVVRQDVAAAIANAALVTGVNSSILNTFVKIESNGNPSAMNGSSRGLLQVQPAAWREAAAWLQARKGVRIGTWEQASLNAHDNALAGAAYIQINSDRLRSLGYQGPLTPAVLYMAHQQGAGGFVELWTISNGGNPKTNHVTVRKMTENPPQDRLGVTTDKATFYRRWMAVAEKKFSS